MSERLLNIKLDIAGKPYEMTIDARNEAKKQEYEEYLEDFNNKRK